MSDQQRRKPTKRLTPRERADEETAHSAQAPHAEQAPRAERIPHVERAPRAEQRAPRAERVPHVDPAVPAERTMRAEKPAHAERPAHAGNPSHAHAENPAHVERPARTHAEKPLRPETASHGRRTARPDQPSDAKKLSRKEWTKPKGKRKKGHLGRNIAIVLLVVIALIGAGAGLYLHSINTKITSGVDKNLQKALVKKKLNEPFYMLLLGVDRSDERSRSGDYGNSDSAYRTDTMILARIDPVKKKVTLVSIPRDTLVDMGEHGQNKINNAYSFGGPAYAVEVVEELCGVPISHYAEVDIDGISKVIDAVGGVTVTLPVDVKDPKYTGLNLKKGEHHLDGETAMLLCRTRHAYDKMSDGDKIRANNQRMIIAAVVKKLLASDVGTMNNTIQTMADQVTCDLNVTEIMGVASEFTGLNVSKDIYSATIPTTSEYVHGGWYEFVDVDALREMMTRVDAGKSPLEKGSEDGTEEYTVVISLGCGGG